MDSTSKMDSIWTVDSKKGLRNFSVTPVFIAISANGI